MGTPRDPALELALAGSGSRDDTKATKLAPPARGVGPRARARSPSHFLYPFILVSASDGRRERPRRRALVARSRRACDAFVLTSPGDERRAFGSTCRMGARVRRARWRDDPHSRARAAADAPARRARSPPRGRERRHPRARASRMGLDGGTTATRADIPRKLVELNAADRSTSTRGGHVRDGASSARARERGRSRRSLSRAVDVVRAHGTKTRGRGRRPAARGRLYDKEAALERILARRGAFVDDGQLHAFANGTNDARKARATKHLREERRLRRSGRRAAARAAAADDSFEPECPCSVSSPDERMNGSSPLDRVDAS